MSAWPQTVRSIRAANLHFHDLRHTGNTFAAAGGTGIKDLMARVGHDSERAAMIYQHQARGADQAITSAIDAAWEVERPQLPGALTWQSGRSRVTVTVPSSPWLMARRS